MFINKIGMEHIESGMNCQDFGFYEENRAYICDGCSEGKHSEVGAKLFCRMQNIYHNSNYVFTKLVDLFQGNPQDLKDFLCFTVLRLKEKATRFVVKYCGDGFVILQDIDGNIAFEELTDGEYPKYYVYNYIDEKYLSHYKTGVGFSEKSYSKEKYQKVGIASDGLRFILNADEELKKKFIECLKSGKEVKTKLFINRNHHIFKDDITIAF